MAIDKPYIYNDPGDFTYDESTTFQYIEYQFIDPIGIDESAIGAPTIKTVVRVQPVGSDLGNRIVSSPTVLPQPVYITPPSNMVDFSSEPSSPTVAPQPVTASPTAIITQEASGVPQINLVISAVGIASGEALGTPAVGARLAPTSILTAEAFGAVTALPQPVAISVSGLASEEAFGYSRFALNPDPVGIPSQEEFGYTSVLMAVGTVGIPTEEALGVGAVLPQPVTVVVPSILSEEVVNGPEKINHRLHPVAYDGSNVAFNRFEEPGTFNFGDVGYFYLESTGEHSLYAYVKLKDVGGIPSEEAFGSLRVSMGVKPVGVPSGEAVSKPDISTRMINVGGIASEEAFGVPSLVGTFIWDRIRKFDYDLFKTLLDKEQYCYAQPEYDQNGTATGDTLRKYYEPEFKELTNAIIAWMDINRTTDMKKFMNGLYTYIVFNTMYGTEYTLYGPSKARNLFTMNGYVSRIKGDPVEYYHDIVLTYDANGVVTDSTTARLDADTSHIGLAYDNQEKPDMDALVAGFIETIGNQTHNLMFTDIPPKATVTKDGMTDEIFLTMDYLVIYENFNVNLDIPPRLLAA